jgi:hypothetical protein
MNKREQDSNNNPHQQKKLIESFPNLIPTTSTLDSYRGYLSILGHEYEIGIELNPKLEGGNVEGEVGEELNRKRRRLLSSSSSLIDLSKAQLFFDKNLTKLLKPHREIISQRLHRSLGKIFSFSSSLATFLPILPHLISSHLISSHLISSHLFCHLSSDLPSFLIELRDILERILRGKSTSQLPSADFYSRLVSEIDTLGWNRLVSIHPSLSSLQFRLSDTARREHLVSVRLPLDYPFSPPICSASLPTAVELRWRAPSSSSSSSSYSFSSSSSVTKPKTSSSSSSTSSSLADIATHFEKALEKFQNVWNELDDLDSNLWIIEPENPQRSSLMRRIALGNHSSLQITLDPLNPRSLPECRFMGADTVIGPLREKVVQNIHLWDLKNRALRYYPLPSSIHLIPHPFPFTTSQLHPYVISSTSLQGESGISSGNQVPN